MGPYLMTFILVIIAIVFAQAKEIAFTFDDAPVGSTVHYETNERTQVLVNKLKKMNVPSVMVFANPCKGKDSTSTIKQLELYKKNGHLIGNHTCTHSRLDDVGFDVYSKDIKDAEAILKPLTVGQKYFRFPYLNESDNIDLRNQVRDWLKNNNYRNGMVSIDNDDYYFTYKLNKAKDLNKKIDYEKVKSLFLSHILGSIDFYDKLAIETIGYSPKHVLLLHEMDATVLFIDSLVVELRAKGWKIIAVDEAFQDRLYKKMPHSTYTNNGVIAQIAHEKTGEKEGYFQFDKISAELDKILGL